jgi:hypothetical protein
VEVEEITTKKREPYLTKKKASEDEKNNRDEESLNNDASPMDTNITRSLVESPLIDENLPIDQPGLGL